MFDESYSAKVLQHITGDSISRHCVLALRQSIIAVTVLGNVAANIVVYGSLPEFLYFHYQPPQQAKTRRHSHHDVVQIRYDMRKLGWITGVSVAKDFTSQPDTKLLVRAIPHGEWRHRSHRISTTNVYKM
jgi:hypothetical protein